MLELKLDDIEEYLHEKGPKKVKNVTGPLDYLSQRFVQVLGMVPRMQRTRYYRDDVSARIKEVLIPEGRVILSGKNRKVIIFDDKSNSYKEAAFDIATGQPVSVEKEFNLDGHNPLELIKTVYFSRNGGEAANFLEKAIEIFDAPVTEIGEHIGDGFNRYFSIRKFS